MSVKDFAGLFDVLAVKRTELVGELKSTIAAYFATSEQAPGDPYVATDDETAPVDWWQHYGFVSRPPEGSEALLLRFGANVFAVASRALAAAGIFGQLSAGDVALFSMGKNAIRLNADGSVSLTKQTAGGQLLILTVGKDDSIKGYIPNGPWFEMSAAKGITFNAGQAPLTLASNVKVQIVAPQLVNAVGVNMLHIAAAKPIACPPGTVPVPNVFG